MSLKIGSLYVALDAEVGAFGKKMQSAAAQIDAFARKVKRMSADVAHVGMAVAGLATGMLMMASKADAGVRAQVEHLKGAFMGLAIQVSHVLLPAVQKLTEFLQLLSGWFASLSPRTKGFVSDFAVAAVSIGAVAFVLARLAPLVSIAAQAFGLLGAAITMLGAPGIAIIGLLVVGAALIHKAWRENWGGIQEFVRKVVENISEYWTKFKDWFSTSFLDAMIDVAASIGEAFGKVELYIKGLREGLDLNQIDTKYIKPYEKQVADQVMTMKGQGGILEPLKLEAKKVTGALGSLLDELLKMAKEVGGPVADAIKKFLGSVPKGPAGPHAGYDPNSAPIPYSDDVMWGIKHAGDASQRVNNTPASKGVTPGTAQSYDQILKGIDDKITDAWDRADYSGVVSAIGERAFEMLTNVEMIGNALKAGAERLFSKMGDMGELINAGMQGFQTGGVWGAVIAVLIEVLSKFERWGELLDLWQGQVQTLLSELSEGLGSIVDAFLSLNKGLGEIYHVVHQILNPILVLIGRVLSALAPILHIIAVLIAPIGRLFDMIGGLLEALAPALEWVGAIFEAIGKLLEELGKTLEPVFKIIGVLLKIVGEAVLGVMWLLLSVWEKILEFVQGFLKGLGQHDQGIDNALDDAHAKKKGLEDKMKALMENDLGSSAGHAAKQVAKLGDAASDATAQLLNFPSGYKVARAEYEATQSGTGGGSGGGSASTSETKKTADELKRYWAKQATRNKGNPTSSTNTGGGRSHPGDNSEN